MSSSSIPQVKVLPKPGLATTFENRHDAYKTFSFYAFRKLPDGSLELVFATANASFDRGPKGSNSLILTIHASGNEVNLLAPGTDRLDHILIKKRYGSIVRGKSGRELLEDFNRTGATSSKINLATCALQYELQTQVLTYEDVVVPSPPMNIPPPPVTPQRTHQSNDDDAATANMVQVLTYDDVVPPPPPPILDQQIESSLCQRLAAATIVNVTINNINNTTVNNDNSNTSIVVNNINTTNSTTRRSQSWD
jgi:hypothetical protein